MVHRVFLSRPETSGASPAAGTPPADRGPLDPIVKAIRAGVEVQDTPLTELVLPDGGVHILFDLGDRPAAHVHGPTTTAAPITLAGRIDHVGIELMPGAVITVLGLPAWELRDRTCALHELLGRAGERWIEVLRDAPPPRRARIAAGLVARHVRRAVPPEPRAATAVAALRRRSMPGASAVTVPDVAVGIGLRVRQLEQVFRDTVGLSPAEITRLARFHRLCRSLAGTDRTLTLADLAARAGYADQAHAAREAKRISGLTLTALRGCGIVQDSPGVRDQADVHARYHRDQ